MRLSLIVATYNNPEMLELVLLSIAQQNVANISNKDVEILIADDGSTDKTKNLIAAMKATIPFKLTHVWHPDKGFFKAEILNRAVSKSSGDYLIFVDGDCVLPKDFIYQHLNLAEERYFVAGNRILLSQPYTRSILESKDIRVVNSGVVGAILHRVTGHANKLFNFLRLSPNAFWRKLRSKNWRYPKGCNFALWRKDYYAVNGFDQEFSGWGHEDSDLFVRLLHSGVLIKDGRFAAPVFHLWHVNASRANASSNWRKLMDRVNDPRFIQAITGIKELA